jgi:hypothetical protein
LPLECAELQIHIVCPTGQKLECVILRLSLIVYHFFTDLLYRHFVAVPLLLSSADDPFYFASTQWDCSSKLAPHVQFYSAQMNSNFFQQSFTFLHEFRDQIHEIAFAAYRRLLDYGEQLTKSQGVCESDLNTVMHVVLTGIIALVSNKPAIADKLLGGNFECLTDKFLGVNFKPDMWARVEDAGATEPEAASTLWRFDAQQVEFVSSVVEKIRSVPLPGTRSESRTSSPASSSASSSPAKRISKVRRAPDQARLIPLNSSNALDSEALAALKQRFAAADVHISKYVVTENKINRNFRPSCKMQILQVFVLFEYLNVRPTVCVIFLLLFCRSPYLFTRTLVRPR